MGKGHNVYKIKLCRWEIKNNEKYENYCKDKDKYREFCIENNFISVGWQPSDGYDLNAYEKYEDYIGAVDKNNKSNRDWGCARNCFEEMQPGDFCWVQMNGDTFYLGKITDQEVQYKHDELEEKLKENNLNPETFGIWRHCKWNKNIKFDDIPGNVIARFLGTMCHVSSENKETFYQYSNYLYNDKQQNFSEEEKLNFWNLVHYDDLEDLVGLFLQNNCDYLIFPSTNKQSTKRYEYKLKNKISKKEAIIQCKHSDDIVAQDYEKYEEDTFLLTIYGQINLAKDIKESKEEDWKKWKTKDGEEITVIKKSCYKNKDEKDCEFFKFDKEALKQWAKENEEIMPQRIQNFLKISK